MDLRLRRRDGRRLRRASRRRHAFTVKDERGGPYVCVRSSGFCHRELLMDIGDTVSDAAAGVRAREGDLGRRNALLASIAPLAVAAVAAAPSHARRARAGPPAAPPRARRARRLAAALPWRTSRGASAARVRFQRARARPRSSRARLPRPALDARDARARRRARPATRRTPCMDHD